VNGRTPEAVAIIPGIDAELGRRRQLRNGKRRKEQEYYTERENLRHTNYELAHTSLLSHQLQRRIRTCLNGKMVLRRKNTP
jgi:hypothetical protein